MSPVKTRNVGHAGKLQIERQDKSFELDKTIQRVEIVNRHGNTTVKRQDENELGIHAVIQRLAPKFALLKLHSLRQAGTLHIEVGYAQGIDPQTQGRLDMAVFLPGTMELSVQTDSDNIKVGAREGRVQATSTSGDIAASSRGQLLLKSDSGQIRAAALGQRWSGASRIETGSGSIVMLVPTFGGVDIDAATGGKLSSNFGLSIHSRNNGGAHAHARYGDGQSQLIVNSASGEVMLEQLVRLDDDERLPEDDDD